MRIDRTHRPWIFIALAILVVSLVLYIIYVYAIPGNPRGGTAAGLSFGIAGYAVMLFEGLLGVRKKVPIWRLGRTQTWMRGHLWLGLLSLPLILFHAGFVFRGPLTAVLMVLLFVVVLSGIVGAIFQHYLPSLITSRVPMETIYEEIPNVREQLKAEADQLVNSMAVEAEHEQKTRFKETYQRSIRPFLEAPETRNAELADAGRAAVLFQSIRGVTPAVMLPILGDLENICEEERQLSRQIRIYHWLHGWLIVHVPISIALLVLGGVHAVVALRY